MSASIAVVVVSYQSAATLDECLQRLRAAQEVAQIRVVDNASRDGSLHILTGRRQWFARHHPFAPETLRAWIPDIADRHVFVCGPASLEAAVVKGVRRAGVPTAHIHHERFGV